MLNLNFLTLLFCALLFASGCSKPATPLAVSNHAARVQIQDTIDTADLNARVAELEESTIPEVCDVHHRATRKALAAAIEKQLTHLEKLVTARNSSPEPDQLPTRKIGPINFRDDLSTPASSDSSFYETVSSWSVLERVHSIINDDPESPYWEALNSAVRSLIVNDGFRLLGQFNMRLGRKDYSILKDVIKEIKECTHTAGCKSPTYSAPVKAIMDSHPAYVALKNDLPTLLALVERNYAVFSTIVNTTIVRSAKNEITLPLNAGDFKGSESELARVIETMWNSPALHVKVRWVSEKEEPKAYKFLIDSALGERAGTDTEEHTVMFPPNTRLKTIGHEIGHVLGFQDHYYTTWNPNTCEYTEEYTPSDLMSSSETGQVTHEEWDELERLYPYVKTN